MSRTKSEMSQTKSEMSRTKSEMSRTKSKWIVEERIVERSTCFVFGEYSHSPKWPFSEIWETRQTRRHLPNHFEMFRQTCWHLPSLFARTRQTSRYLPNAMFWKNVTRLAKFAWVLSDSGKCGVSSQCLV